MTSLPATNEVCVECVFAVNAPAQGCFALFSGTSLVAFNITIFNTKNSMKASACTALPDLLPDQTAKEFLVTIYDVYQGVDDVDLSEPVLILSHLVQVEPVSEEPNASVSEEPNDGKIV